MKQLIIAPHIAEAPPAPVINEEGQALKKELVLAAFEIQKITSVETRDLAIDVAGRIKGHITSIENARKEIKEPFYRMGQAIDAAAKKHVLELEEELRRLNNTVGAFNAELAAKARAEQEARDREARRLAEEAAAKQRELDRQAELLRKEQEAAALKQQQALIAAAAKGRELSPAAKAKALQASLDAQDKEDALEIERRKQQEAVAAQQRKLEEDRLAAAEAIRQQKATGGAQRTEIDIEVTDINLLYAARKDCVKLTPDLTQIKYVINSANDPDFRLPGVLWSRRAVFSTRAK